MALKKSRRVVRVLVVQGIETATISTIARASKGRVQVEDAEHTWYDAQSGHEIDPPIPGCYSRLIKLEDGE